MNELLPCPFCGGTPTLEEPGADGAQRVVCRNIRCFGPATSPVVYAADAIAMWNRRPSPSISEGEVVDALWRLSLVIESAVRNADPANYEQVSKLLRQAKAIHLARTP